MERRTFLGSAAAPLAGWFGRWGGESPRRRSNHSSNGPEEWPQAGFDGANSGYVPDCGGTPTNPRIDWTHDLNQVGSLGYLPDHSPVASDDVVYEISPRRESRQESGQDDGFRPADGRALLAVDLASGEELWTVELGGEQSGSPLVGEAAVFVATRDRITAFDKRTGEERWHVSLDHGLGSPPRLAHGRLYWGTGGSGEDDSASEAGELIAIDTESGQVDWRYQPNADHARFGPTAVADGRVVGPHGGPDSQRVRAFDAGSGEPLWRWDGELRRVPPTVAGDTVILGVESDEEDAIVALELDSGEERWRRPIDGGFDTSPAVAEGVVYAVADSREGCPNPGGLHCESNWGRLSALDLASGDELWTVELDPGVQKPAVVGDTIFVPNGDGLGAVSTDGETLWHQSFDFGSIPSIDAGAEVVTSSPAIVGNRAIVRGNDDILRAVTWDVEEGSGGDDGWWGSGLGRDDCASVGRERSDRRDGGWWSR